MPHLRVNDTELHYLDEGQGERVVLFLHAFPLSSAMWSRQVAEVAKDHRVIAPDYRGLGRSAPSAEISSMSLLARDVQALLGARGIARAALVGLSMGGYLSFELYRQAPELFRGLALADTRASADTAEGRAGREDFARGALAHGLGWVADQLTPKLLRPTPSAAAVAELHALIAAGTPEGVAAAQRGMAERPDSFGTLASITCPTLVLVGAEDTLTPPADAEAMRAKLPKAELVYIPEAGHISCIENPNAFTRALRDFLAALP